MLIVLSVEKTVLSVTFVNSCLDMQKDLQQIWNTQKQMQFLCPTCAHEDRLLVVLLNKFNEIRISTWNIKDNLGN